MFPCELPAYKTVRPSSGFRIGTVFISAPRPGRTLPEAVLRRSGRRVIARRLSPELQRTVGVVYKQKTGLSTAGQMFLSELKASIPSVHG